jgi:hypothetical protein
MYSNRLTAVSSTIAVMVVVLATTPFIRPISGDEISLKKDQVSPDIKAFPPPARPTSQKIYEGRIRDLLGRKDTFGFSVRDKTIPSEYGFYVENNQGNATIIQTVMVAAKNAWTVRVYYDPTTNKAEAVETWGW